MQEALPEAYAASFRPTSAVHTSQVVSERLELQQQERAFTFPGSAEEQTPLRKGNVRAEPWLTKGTRSKEVFWAAELQKGGQSEWTRCSHRGKEASTAEAWAAKGDLVSHEAGGWPEARSPEPTGLERSDVAEVWREVVGWRVWSRLMNLLNRWH